MLRTFPLLSVLVAGVAAQANVEALAGREPDTQAQPAAAATVAAKPETNRIGTPARFSVRFEHRLANRTSRPPPQPAMA